MNQAGLHTLDHPVWSALSTRHKHLRHGGLLALRYQPDVAPFAAVAADSPQAFQGLHQLLRQGEQVALLALDPIEPISALKAEQTSTIHQMVATSRVTDSVNCAEVVRLGHDDVREMLELAKATKPGPFGDRTNEMGNYIGIRDHGRLIAMAGERMKLDGYVEISAVCVNDEYRGRGLAGQLVNILRRNIEQRGDVPFLHVFSGNETAIRLYQRIGFELRQVFRLTIIEHVNLDET